ncbi:MAG TPA: isochorismatase family protein [Miltoncostaea sp.]|nr:isochorismatase family protein [Miltoncostaea sp.]
MSTADPTDDVTPRPGDALVIVDVQGDFVTGSLAVPGGAEVIPPLNRAAAAFAGRGLPVVATRDWHPDDHMSFAEQGGPWPPHCVAGTPGAEAAEGLDLPPGTVTVEKATTAAMDAYSAFSGTDLADDLRARGVRRVVVGGLATDYCVLNTVTDAVAEGFDVVVLADAIRAVEVKPGDGDRAEEAMRRAGARFATVEDVTG